MEKGVLIEGCSRPRTLLEYLQCGGSAGLFCCAEHDVQDPASVDGCSCACHDEARTPAPYEDEPFRTNHGEEGP